MAEMVATESFVIFDFFGMLMTDKTLPVSDLLNLFSAFTALEGNALGRIGKRTVFTCFFKVESHT